MYLHIMWRQTQATPAPATKQAANASAVPCAAERVRRQPTDLSVLFLVFPFAFVYVSIRVGQLALQTPTNNATARPTQTQKHAHNHIREW